MASTSRQDLDTGITIRDGRLYIDLNAADPLPLLPMLEFIKYIRVRHEVERRGSAEAAARSLQISRYTVYRVLHRFGASIVWKKIALEPI